MTDIVRIVGIAIVVSVLLSILRKDAAPIGAQLAIAFVVLVLLFLMEPLGRVIRSFGDLAQGAGVRSVYLALVLKAVAIAFITSLGAELAKDAGENSVGATVEMTGKVFILLLAVPVITALLDALAALLPG